MERCRHDLGKLRCRYEAGATVRVLAAELGVTKNSICRWLKLVDATMRPRGGSNYKGKPRHVANTLLENRELLIGMTASQIAKKWHLDRSYIYRVLKKYELEYARRW